MTTRNIWPQQATRRVSLAIVGLTLGVSLGACGGQSVTTTTLRAAEVNEVSPTDASPALSARYFTATDSGEYAGDSFMSSWRTGTSSGGLRYISELMTEAYAVQRDRLFEFDSAGMLVHYVEHTRSTMQRDIERGSAHIGTIELEFAGGEAVYRARKAGDASRSIRQWEVDRVLERAELLRAHVAR